MEEDYLKFFRLQEGEKIIDSIKPLPGLKWMFFLQGLIGWFFIILFGGLWIIIPLVFLFAAIGGIVGAILALVTALIGLVAIVVIPYTFASMNYNKRFYWITNKRVVGKRGLIGYSVNSIPLERISDVIISRSFIESIFGFGSIHIQTLAGQASMRGKWGAEGNLQAVPEPEELQQKIFELVKGKRKDEGLTM